MYLDKPRDTTHNHNTHRTTSKKHQHHDLPRPPASSGSNWTGECDCRTSRNWYRSPQHGNAFFYVKLTFPLFYLLLFCMPLTGAHGDKRYVFLVNTCAFYSSVASNQRALTPAIRRYIICWCRSRPHHVLAWFWTKGGGGAIVMVVVGGTEVGCGKYLGSTIHRYDTAS